jgi:hypothetical protein
MMIHNSHKMTHDKQSLFNWCRREIYLENFLNAFESKRGVYYQQEQKKNGL